MTEDDMKKFLEDNREDIALAIKAKMIEGLTQHVSYQLPSSVLVAVQDFIAAEIIPGVKVALMDQKGVILEAAIKASCEIGDLVAKTLVKTATESLTGYKASDVIKTLMGVR